MATRRSSRNARRAVADATQQPAPTPARSSSRTPAGSSSSSRGSRSSRKGAEEDTPRRGRSSARGSSRRRRSGAAGASDKSGDSRKVPIGSDGKASIACPGCGKRYKIAEDNLETKVKCVDCHRTFIPYAAAQSRHSAKQDNSKPIIYGLVAVAAIVIVGVVINSLGGSNENSTNAATKNDKAPPELGGGTQEVKCVRQWAASVGDRDAFNAARTSDLDSLQKKFDIEKKNLHSRSFGDAKKALEDKIIAALFDHEDSLVFRAYKPTYGRIESADMLDAKFGTVLLSLAPRDSKIHAESAEVRVRYGWDSTDERFKVRDWKVVQMARADYLLEKVDKKNPRKKHKPHPVIGKPKEVDTTFAGRRVKVSEAELVPLPHLDSTSEEDRKKIDALVMDMIDLNDSGMKFNRATFKLEKFGKAAVPRVLNKMYETKMRTQDDVIVVNRLCRFLRILTGERFGFNPADQKAGSDIGGTEKERVSALKQWYAWWGRYYDRDDWQNIDSDEEAELTEAEIEAKRRAEYEAKRKKKKSK